MLQQHLGSNHSLIVLPDDSEQPFLDALNKAQESLPVKMFVFSDPALNVAPAAEIAGGVASMVPAAGTSLGARLLGLVDHEG